MTRDDIYDHLAQVYLGKKKKNQIKKQRQINAWFVINVVITFVIFASTFYGLTAFFTQSSDDLHNKIIYALNKGPIRVKYNLHYPYPPVKSFSLSVPEMNVSKYTALQFSVRGLEEGYPGVMRIELKNRKNETASVFVDKIEYSWKSFNIPFEEFENITDWSNIEEISFVLEAWNAEKKEGIVLIDDICFSS